MTALLAIDIGCQTGIAFRRAEDGSEVWRTWDLPGVGGARVSKFYDRLVRLHMAERFERVGYEAPFVDKYVSAAEVLFEFKTMVLFFAYRCDLPCQGFRPSEIKCAIGLKGNARKEAMIARIRALGYPVEDEHQADAMALLQLLKANVQPAEVVRREAKREAKRAPDLFTSRKKVAACRSA